MIWKLLLNTFFGYQGPCSRLMLNSLTISGDVHIIGIIKIFDFQRLLIDSVLKGELII